MLFCLSVKATVYNKSIKILIIHKSITRLVLSAVILSLESH